MLLLFPCLLMLLVLLYFHYLQLLLLLLLPLLLPVVLNFFKSNIIPHCPLCCFPGLPIAIFFSQLTAMFSLHHRCC